MTYVQELPLYVTIGYLAVKSGVHRHTIRRYTEHGWIQADAERMNGDDPDTRTYLFQVERAITLIEQIQWRYERSRLAPEHAAKVRIGMQRAREAALWERANRE